MTQVLNLSDYHLILSDEHSRFITRSSSQTSPPACAPSASDRTDTARLADRDLQTLRAAQLPLCRRNWAWPQAISFHNQSNRRAPAGRLRAECGPRRSLRVPRQLPQIARAAQRVLKELSHSFGKLYSHDGRPSIPPEQLLSALLLQVFYGLRSERQLMEQLNYNLLFRWFVGLSPDDPVWDPTVFTKNRDRLQNGEVFAKFMTKLLNHPQVKPLLSDEHFSVDGTLIEAWASQKSFRPKDGSGDDDGGANFHGQKRKNATHASMTDPDCRLYRKAAGREAKLCYMGHATMENRHGLAVAGMVTLATGTAERRASETMLKAKAKE